MTSRSPHTPIRDFGVPKIKNSFLARIYKGKKEEAVRDLYGQFDTADIAAIVGCSEADIYNERNRQIRKEYRL